MKKRLLVVAGIFVFIFSGCTPEDMVSTESPNYIKKSVLTKNNKEKDVPRTTKSRDQVVIRYKKSFTENQKDSIRDLWYVKKYKRCSCGDPYVELWYLDEGVIDAEGAVSNLPRTGDVEGNYQFDLFLTNKDGFVNNPMYEMQEKVAPPGNRKTVNVAIIDTGVDYDYFPQPFLLNSSNNSNCREEVSGWDFVNGDADIRDDHQYGHGTLVTKIITNGLDSAGLDYRILMLKAFNNEGKGSYWNLVCAMSYLKQKAKSIDLVNMSFGWYDIESQSILQDMIKSMNKTLFVTSAGNAGVDTDGEDRHFPSGYALDNIIAVGGYETTGNVITNSSNQILEGVNLAEYSNYGTTSIDAVAAYEDFQLLLQKPGQEDINATPVGTSFSAAYTTAKAASFMKNSFFSPVFVKSKMLSSAYFSDIILQSTRTGKVFLYKE